MKPPEPSPPSQPAELFVYYEVERGCCDELKAAVRAFQQHLCATHAGLVARLLRRVDTGHPPGPTQTWMEIYFSASGISVPLQGLIERAQALPPQWVLGPRHMEVFTAVD